MQRQDDLRSRAVAWHEEDPDPISRDELGRLLQSGDDGELADRFRGPLEFGTAGLRGLVGAGPNRMNRLVVARATAGLARHLLDTVPGAAERGIVVGYDGRHGSVEFAEETVRVAAGAGFRVHRFDRIVSTPCTAFAVLDTGAAAGVMVTASHNPPRYNGYKVYWGNGAQIIPPQDRDIAAAIARVGRYDTIPRAPDDRLVRTLGPDVERRYLDGVRALALHPETPRDIVIAYTALHGTGERFVRAALAAAGFTRLHTVAAQAEPDGDFPTVAFPNPEEPGAMDLVLALAREVSADLVVANDPDADRLAIAARAADGGYVTLTGNEIGCLLAHYLLDQGVVGPDRLVINTIVSSPLLGAIATAHGARHEQTLTGFKWIANRAIALEKEGARFVCGYEEALGYTAGTLVRDKDGIGAATVFADLCAWTRSQGRSVLDELERVWRRYGMVLSRQVSLVLPGQEGQARIASLMEAVRSTPRSEIGGQPVAAVVDLTRGTRTVRGGAPAPAALPPSDVIVIELDGGHRVMIRPSGTEPKIKYYFDARVDLGASEPISDARARGEAILDALARDMLPAV